MNRKSICLMFLLSALAQVAAQAAAAGALPWDNSFIVLATSLSGPVALSVGLIGFVITGCTLVFGHDWGAFAKSGALVVAAVSFIVAASKFMTPLFGVGGATV